MSSSDAQRSPVHHATEDSSREPSGPNVAQPGVNPPAAAGFPGDGAGNGGGNVEEDRKHLLPEASAQPGQRRTPDDANAADPDESNFGGPLDLDDPDRV